jgi:hypothetical protein
MRPRVVADTDYAATITNLMLAAGYRTVKDYLCSGAKRHLFGQKQHSRELVWSDDFCSARRWPIGTVPLRIEPYGKGQTHVLCKPSVPITNLVAGLKNQALNEAKTTVRAIKAEAERRAAGKEA